MAVAPRRYLTPNPPSPPQMGGGGSLKFPKDLDAGGRQYYTNMYFVDYGQFGGAFGQMPWGGGNTPTGESITLPLPRQINDTQMVIWEEASLVSAALGAAQGMGGAIGAAAGGAQGLGTAAAIAGASGAFGGAVRLNPALLMMFKQPSFKEWHLQWTLAPNSQDETEAITKKIGRAHV